MHFIQLTKTKLVNYIKCIKIKFKVEQVKEMIIYILNIYKQASKTSSASSHCFKIKSYIIIGLRNTSLIARYLIKSLMLLLTAPLRCYRGK